MITYDDFRKVDIRSGRIMRVEDFLEARKPAYKLWIDFGELGIKQSSAQIRDLYSKEDLVGRMVLAVVNLEPKRVAGFVSEVLVLGLDSKRGGVILLEPDKNFPDIVPGQRVY